MIVQILHVFVYWVMTSHMKNFHINCYLLQSRAYFKSFS